jgi:hypothetical protein
VQRVLRVDAPRRTGKLFNVVGAEIAMTEHAHKFKIGQTVNLIPSKGRSAASGHYEIISLRPADGGSPQYRIKSKNESHERVVSEGDLILFQL